MIKELTTRLFREASHPSMNMRGGKPILLLLLIVGAVYLPSFPGDFHFDDYLLLLDNPDVNSSDFRYAGFLDHYGGRPLTLLSFHWNYHWAGRNPSSYVAINVGLHLLACVLLFAWVWELTDRTRVAFACALLFGIHPLQTQAVNYIWSRSMLLMAVFGLAALWLARRRHPCWSLVLFQLAIWSRTEAMAMTPFLAAQGVRLPAAGALVGLNLVGFMFGLWRVAPAETAWQHSDAVGYWLAQPLVLLKYLSMMVLPIGLSIDHDFRTEWTFHLLVEMAPALLLIAVWRLSGTSPLRIWAVCWIFLLLLPAALIPNEDLFNESRAYLALAGYAFLMANLAFAALPGALESPAGKVAVAGILLFLSLAGGLRNHQWNDNLQLWREAAELYPEKVRIQYNLGHAYLLRQELESAQAAFETAIRLNPKDDLSYAALGYCAEVKGDWAAAETLYRRAVELNSTNGYAARGLERAERQTGSSEPRSRNEEKR